jgi:hypothetical protein
VHNKDPRREAGVVCDQLTLRIVQCSSTQDEPTVSRISATLIRRAHPVAYGHSDKVGTPLRAQAAHHGMTAGRAFWFPGFGHWG